MTNPRIQHCGIGLRAQHIDQILAEQPTIPWLEVLTDNYLLEGGVQQDYLLEVAEHYPLTFHGVGMSLGSTDPLNLDYIAFLDTVLLSTGLNYGIRFHNKPHFFPLIFREILVFSNKAAKCTGDAGDCQYPTRLRGTFSAPAVFR